MLSMKRRKMGILHLLRDRKERGLEWEFFIFIFMFFWRRRKGWVRVSSAAFNTMERLSMRGLDCINLQLEIGLHIIILNKKVPQLYRHFYCIHDFISQFFTLNQFQLECTFALLRNQKLSPKTTIPPVLQQYLLDTCYQVVKLLYRKYSESTQRHVKI